MTEEARLASACIRSLKLLFPLHYFVVGLFGVAYFFSLQKGYLWLQRGKGKLVLYSELAAARECVVSQSCPFE